MYIRFVSSYQGESTFQLTGLSGDQSSLRLEIRWNKPPSRDFLNYTDKEYERDIVSKVGRYSSFTGKDLTPEIHREFMAWLSERKHEDVDLIPSYWDNGWHTYDWYEPKE